MKLLGVRRRLEIPEQRKERGIGPFGQVLELPAKPSVGMTDDNANNPVFGPFIRGLAYANTTKFANESGQRQILMDMVQRMDIEGQSAADSIAIAADAEQKLLDEYYAD